MGACRRMQRSPMRCGHRAVREPHWPLRDDGPAACPARRDLGSRFICIQPENLSSGRSRRACAGEVCVSGSQVPPASSVAGGACGDLAGGWWGGAPGRLALWARTDWSPSVPRSLGVWGGASAEDAWACTGQGCGCPGSCVWIPAVPERRRGPGPRASGTGGQALGLKGGSERERTAA